MRTRLVGWPLALAAVVASVTAFADDSGKPTPAPAEEAEKPEDVAAAKVLEKKLSAPNKLDLVDAIEALGTMDTPTSRKVLMTFIASTPNSEYGSKAVRALGKKGNASVVDFLCGKDGARSSRVLIAEAACQSLAEIGDKRAIPTLLECMKADKEVVVCAAVEAVVKLDRAAEGLADRLASLSTTKYDTVRVSVAKALGDLASPKAVQTLIAMAKDANSIVRQRVCESIAKLAPPEARKAMEDLAAHDKNKEVRQAAADALLRLPAAPQGGK